MVKFKPHERYPWFQMGVTRVIDLSASTGFRAKFKQVIFSARARARAGVRVSGRLPRQVQADDGFL